MDNAGTLELTQLLEALARPSALYEGAWLAACLFGSWAVVQLLARGKQSSDSILFGRHVLDGVLFPVFALLSAMAARHLLPAEVTPAVFRIALPILVSLVAIRLTVRVLRMAFPHSQLMRFVERSVSWIAWLAVVLWILGLLPLFLDQLDDVQWTVGAVKISLRSVLEGVVNVVVVMMLVLWLSAVLEQRLLARATGNLSVRKIAANALRALMLFVGLMVALSAAGIDLTALGVFGGALGVGIGLGMQKLASNYVSGFVVLAERSLRIGDLVRVDGFEGRITDINTRATVIRAGNGRESIVPNEMLTTQRVENASRSVVRAQLTSALQIPYDADVVAVRERLLAAIASVPRVLAEPAPEVNLQDFTADGVLLNMNWWISEPENGPARVRSNVNLAILQALEAMGVEVARAQRVVHHVGAEPGGPLLTDDPTAGEGGGAAGRSGTRPEDGR